MSTVIPQSELTKRALEWLCAQREERPGAALRLLIDEAAVRFNLGPLDVEFLERCLAEATGGGTRP